MERIRQRPTCLGLHLLHLLMAVAVAAAVSSPAAAAIPASQRAALIQFYEALDGPHWPFQRGWLGAPGTECSWGAVTCTGDTVTGLFFFGSYHKGLLPGPAFTALPDLDSFSISTHNDHGPIPPQLVQLPHLERLFLIGGFGPPLPPALFDSPTLVQLVLAEQSHDLGAIPDLAGLTAIEDLVLQGFTGPVPDLGDLVTLRLVELFGLDPGPVPEWLLELPHLEGFGFSSVTGEFPAWVCDRAGLSTLVLVDSPQLTPSAIPACLARIVDSLQVLNLRGSARSGSIPAWLEGFHGLLLDLTDNHLTGQVPDFLASVPGDVLLRGNRLKGALPASFATPHPDSRFDLRWNGLSSGDPAVVAALNSLEHSDLLEDFRNTQTTPPRFALAAGNATATTLDLTWAPIRYSSDPGYYSIFMGDRAEGEFHLVGRVGPKTATTFTVTGLAPATTYFFRFRAVTPAHGEIFAGNPENTVISLFGPAFRGTTAPAP